MAGNIENEIEKLRRMTSPQLRQLHFDQVHEWPGSHHRQFLWRQLAWKIQAAHHGGLSQELKQLALAIARNHPMRSRIADSSERRSKCLPIENAIKTTLVTRHDSRVPFPGSLLIKDFHGTTHIIQVLDHGFEYDGKTLSSLSAIAQAISGTKWNGFVFLDRGRRTIPC